MKKLCNGQIPDANFKQMEEIGKSDSFSSKSCGINYDNGNHQENHGHQKLLDYQESVSSHFKHTGFVIDQTPTPTRFLKHFEDVSLFQDINLNPFDLEFRKASQNRSSKIYLTVTENHGISGSLDTPRILPPVESDETISSTSHDDSHVQVSTTRVHTQLSSIVTPVITEPEVTKHNSLNLPLVDRNEGRKRLTLNVSASEDGQTSNIISTPTPVITAGPSVSQSLGVGNLTPILNTPTIVTSNIPQISLNGVGLGLNEIGSPVLSHNFRISSSPPLNDQSSNNLICDPIETTKPPSQAPSVSLPRSIAPSTLSYSGSTSSPQSATVLQLLLRLPNGQSIPVEIPATPVVSSVSTGKSSPAIVTSVASVVPAYPTTPFTSVITNPTPSLAKMKLKQVLSTSNTAAKPGSLRLSRASTADRIADLTKIKTSSSSNSGHGNISDGVKCLNSVDCNGPKGTRRRKSSPEEDPEEKRKKFLERNRVAAVRCREKKKRLVESMFTRTDELNALNQKLQSEVVSLRSEVATLKCLLLKHKTCPVTLAMQGREGCYSDNIRDNETAFEIQNSTCVSQASIVQPMVQSISNTSLKISSQNISQDSSSFIVSSEELPLDAANKFRKRSQSLSSISYPVPIQPILVNAQGVSTNETKAFAGVDVIKKEPKHILPKESPLLLSKNSLGNLASCSTSMSSTAQSNALSFSQSKIILLENTSLTNDVRVPSHR
ncbi:Cyclic AMP-dependent transcription factor ATF-2 [Armadillidium vulgare]|nr:Cyclic AMP-dependent transcription factor ATF-2 [Armadillidium vulgare]